MSQALPSRRSILTAVSASAATAGIGWAGPSGRAAAGMAGAAVATETERDANAEHALFTAVKFGMVQEDLSVEDKFKLLLDLGYDGVELDSPSDLDRREVVEARDKTGIIIHGVVNSTHWNVRHSHPDPTVRAQAMENLKTALNDARLYGADTVLLVPGAVRDPENENFQQVWDRSTEEIRKAIPLAQKHGIRIAIEVVWNDFITTPQQLIQYVDQFYSPWVGAYFDVSNMIRFGVPPATWIRMLNTRMLKFDFKGYSHQRRWVPIGEGDEDWPQVRNALRDIGYHGWTTAEVGGGDRNHLRQIRETMDRVVLGKS